MLLKKFSVSNFRSITSAHAISLSKKTILIGKNNEGKSNILKALNIAMHALQEHAWGEKRRKGVLGRKTLKYEERFYDWERDFPIKIQDRKTGNESIFKLEFSLTEDELVALKRKTKLDFCESLSILNRSNRALAVKTILADVRYE